MIPPLVFSLNDCRMAFQQANTELAALQRWRWIPTSEYEVTPPTTSTIRLVDPVAFTGVLPLKVILANETIQYALARSISGTLITIGGAPLSTAIPIVGLLVGLPEMVVHHRLFVPGTYGTVQTEMVFGLGKEYPLYLGSKGYIVRAAARHAENDTGAAQPYVNPTVNNNKVLTLAGGNGFQPARITTADSGVGISPTYCAVSHGDRLDVACTVAGTNGDAADLTVAMSIVLE